MAEEEKSTSKTYVKKKRTNFQRTKFRAYVKLGKGQKSKQRYKKANGRHNKTRQKWKSRPRMVEIGYRNKVDTRMLINGKMPVLVKTLADLKKMTKENIAIIGKIGMKAKVELIKEAEKQGIEMENINIKKFLRQADRNIKHRSKLKQEKKAKVKAAEKKTDKKKDTKAEDKGKEETKK